MSLAQYLLGVIYNNTLLFILAAALKKGVGSAAFDFLFTCLVWAAPCNDVLLAQLFKSVSAIVVIVDFAPAFFIALYKNILDTMLFGDAVVVLCS